MTKDLYQLLGVKETATADEIKRAYRDLAKRYHPDRTGGDNTKEAQFKEISAAYNVLSDPKQREQYDTIRRGGFGRGGAPGGMPFDLGNLAGMGFDEIFRQVFGRAGRRGGKRVVFEQRSGGWPGAGSAFDIFGGGRDTRGGVRRPAAPPEEEVVTTASGEQLLRQGDDYVVDVGVTIEEAVLGARIPVPTVDGMVTVTLPPGTSSGQRLRLRGKGAARAGGGRGDEYVVVQIVVPSSLAPRARELIREFSRLAPTKPRG